MQNMGKEIEIDLNGLVFFIKRAETNFNLKILINKIEIN